MKILFAAPEKARGGLIGDVTDTAIKGIAEAVAENIRRVERNEFPLNRIL